MSSRAPRRLAGPLRRLRTRAGRRRLAPVSGLGADAVITLRLENGTDGSLGGLVELSGLDGHPGASLVAEVDGEPRAALSLVGGTLLADPFHASDELGSLLRLRAAQLETRTRLTDALGA